MIPSTAIAFDGNRAWVVVTPDPKRGGISGRWFARPCDTCGSLVRAGDQVIDPEGRRWVNGRSVARYEPFTCPDCDGTGRHTFEIEAECEVVNSVEHRKPFSRERVATWDGSWRKEVIRYRVSVVEGMVLPITDNDECDGTHRIVLWDATTAFTCTGPKGPHEFITLPPDAARLLAEGKTPWAVLLDVHESEK